MLRRGTRRTAVCPAQEEQETGAGQVNEPASPSTQESEVPEFSLSPAQERSRQVLEEARRGRTERLRAAARKGDEIIVPLFRGAGQKNVPWGLVFDEMSFRLLKCEVDSIAARSPQAHACIGLVLKSLEVDDKTVHRSLVVRLAERCKHVKLRFYAPDAAPATHRPSAPQSLPVDNQEQGPLLPLVDNFWDL